MTDDDRDRLTDVSGVAVGHWTDATARTGCTVILLPEGTVASGEVRGGAPASRELALLEPSRLVNHVDAIVLTGGSAFGLAAADGVMSWLEERHRGWPTPAGPVPIVPSLALFDLLIGDPSVRPGPSEGRAACDAATTGAHEVGLVGAGTGCTINKWRGADHVRPGALVAASERLGDVVVAVLIAVNAWGGIGESTVAAADVMESPGAPTLARPTADEASRVHESATQASAGQRPATPVEPMANTTIGAVVTNARLDKVACMLLAQAAHDGLARAVFPAHSRSDGDAFIAAATGEHDLDVDSLRTLTTAAVERAILGLGQAEVRSQR